MVGESILARRRAIALILILIFIIMAPPASAHPASSVTCTYDFAAQELSVTITHTVGDPNSHYIQTVDIRKNDILVDTRAYTSQPGNTFTYVYPVPAQNGDVLSASAHCNLGGSRSGQVTVQGAAPADTTDPLISIAQPQDGAIFDVSQITVSGTASDNAGLQKIEVRVGTGVWRLATGTASWSVSVGLVVGSNTITAMATDLAGNTATDQVTVVYTPSANPDTTPPAISVTSPANGTSFDSPELTVRGTASDDVALASVEYRLNGGTWAQATGTESWSFQVGLSDGNNTIEVRAIDTSGNSAGTAITVIYSAPIEPPATRPLWHYHATFMVAGLAFMLIAIPIVKMKPKNWLKFHRALGISAAVVVTIGFIIGIQMAGGRFAGLHNVVGLITALMAMAEPALGFGIFKAKEKKNIRLVHIWLGRITPIMMVITILLGLSIVGII